MRNAMTVDEPLTRLSAILSDQAPLLLAAGVALVSLGLYLGAGQFGLPLVASGTTMASLAGIGRMIGISGAVGGSGRRSDLMLATGHDPTPCFGTTKDGEIWFLNPAAKDRFASVAGQSLTIALGGIFAEPASALRRLQDKALAVGATRHDAVTKSGAVRLTVVDLNDDGFLWRFDEATTPSGPADAVVHLPLMTVDNSGAVTFANDAMHLLLGQKVKHIDRVLTEFPPPSGSICSVTTITGSLPMRVVAIDGGGTGQQLVFLPPDDGAWQPSEGASAATEDLPVGLLELAADGHIASANRLARELLLLGDDTDLAGVTLSDRLEGMGRPVRDWLDEAAKSRGLSKPEVLRVRSDEAELFLKITLGRAPGRGPVRLIAVLNDATELKTLEAQFVQSQKMQAIGQLAGGVAHDFNNLLTAISGHCDLMLLRHDQGDSDYGDLVQIHQNANRAASLVGQLLAFSRKQTLQPQIIDLRDTLSDLTHLLNRLVGERITLTLHHEVGLPTIRADRRQLEQVIMNLVVNARDAMPEGGEIRVETMERILGDGLTRDRAKVPPGRYVVVKVEDHGTGIAPDKIGKIFEPFYTTKRTGEGTGLGLSTAYGIVKQSDGYIFADSAVGCGTVFTLYFPAHDQPAEVRSPPPVAGRASVGIPRTISRPPPANGRAFAQATASMNAGRASHFVPAAAGAVSGMALTNQDPLQPALTGTEASNAVGSAAAAVPDLVPGEGGVVLLVEDEAPVRAFASRALRMRGYTVIEAENAEEALATLQDPALKVDVFLTDVIMPGMDGPTWVRLALQDRPNVKVIFVSGYAEDSFGEEQARIPNSVFLPKPFSLSELTATVQDQLN